MIYYIYHPLSSLLLVCAFPWVMFSHLSADSPLADWNHLPRDVLSTSSSSSLTITQWLTDILVPIAAPLASKRADLMCNLSFRSSRWDQVRASFHQRLHSDFFFFFLLRTYIALGPCPIPLSSFFFFQENTANKQLKKFLPQILPLRTWEKWF